MVKLIISVSLLSLLTEHGQPQLHSASGDSVSREDVAHSNSSIIIQIVSNSRSYVHN